MLTNCRDGDGYLYVCLYKNKIRENKKIHKLVAEHFIGDPKNGFHVHHIDRDKENNCVGNLVYMDAHEHISLDARGERHPNAKLTEETVILICEMILDGKDNTYISKIFGVNKCTISNIRGGRIWRHITDVFDISKDAKRRVGKDGSIKVLELLGLGIQKEEIAKMFNVKERSIRNIRAGRTYK